MKIAKTAACLFAVVAVAAIAAPAAPDYAQSRAARASALTQPYGWFSLIALEWLAPDATTTVGSAKDNKLALAGLPAHLMSLAEHGGAVTIASADKGVTLGGKAVTAGQALPTNEDDASALAFGATRFWVIDRAGKKYLRVKDPSAKARVRFHGLQWYPVNPHYRVEARWVPFTTPHTVTIVNQIGLVTPMVSAGYVEFTLDGHAERLTALSADQNSLFFVMTDRTAPKSTDGGGRFLTTGAPTNGLTKPGTVTIDFNEAVNPPCAYSPYATCPRAPKENRLDVAIPAGEKLYDAE